MNKVLVLIPARGGSKGIPGKNIKPLNGKPLIYYTLDVALELFNAADVCVSTDDFYIAQKVKEYGLDVPFIRPAELATDTASTNDVLTHALDFFEKKGLHYLFTLILQPTSPFRKTEHIRQALSMAEEGEFEMIMSVKETDANPYYVLFEEDEKGVLQKSKPATFTRRQDCPKVWQANGAIYLINNKKFREKGDIGLLDKKKLIMESRYSLDLDTPFDWSMAECLLEKNLID